MAKTSNQPEFRVFIGAPLTHYVRVIPIASRALAHAGAIPVSYQDYSRESRVQKRWLPYLQSIEGTIDAAVFIVPELPPAGNVIREIELFTNSNKHVLVAYRAGTRHVPSTNSSAAFIQYESEDQLPDLIEFWARPMLAARGVIIGDPIDEDTPESFTETPPGANAVAERSSNPSPTTNSPTAVLRNFINGSRLLFMQTSEPWKEDVDAFGLEVNTPNFSFEPQMVEYIDTLGSDANNFLALAESASNKLTARFPRRLIFGSRPVPILFYVNQLPGQTREIERVLEHHATAIIATLDLAISSGDTSVLIPALESSIISKETAEESALRVATITGRFLASVNSSIDAYIYSPDQHVFDQIVKHFSNGYTPTTPTPYHPDYRTRSNHDEACLSAPEYARALRRFFIAADDELCFGLFGHWGRGKSYLMELTAAELDSHKHETIFFSAWRFPSTPQLWVHLYESIARRATRAGSLDSWPIVARAGLARHGIAPLIAALLFFAAALIPMSTMLSIAQQIAAVVGIGILLLILQIRRGFVPMIRTLKHKYLQLARHDEKLGLQAVIGDDLRALLLGWITDNNAEIHDEKSPWSDPGAYTLFTFATSVICLALIVPIFASPTPDVAVAIARWAIAIAFQIAAIRAWDCMNTGARDTRGAVLVVDDLDRCSEEVILEVIESMRVLLEQPGIQNRLRVVMLIDEQALENALLWKYEQRLKRKMLSEASLFAEHLEKLFVAHLRLPELATDELEEVAARLAPIHTDQIPEESNAQKAADDQPCSDTDTPTTPSVPVANPTAIHNNPATSLPERRTWFKDTGNRVLPIGELKLPSWLLPDRSKKTTPPPAPIPHAPPPPEPPREALDAEDKAAIHAAIAQLKSAPYRAGPRSVRCLIARYQLMRVLLEELGISEFDRDKVAKSLASGTIELSGADNRVTQILQQLTLRTAHPSTTTTGGPDHPAE